MAVVAAGTALSACSGSAGAKGDPLLMVPVPSAVTVTTGTVAGLGMILTDSTGHALYMFPPDAGGQVHCTGACAGTWPPLVIESGHKPTARGQVNAADLGVIADPNTGAQIVTYGGYPLYRYAGDLTAGVANGQNLFSDGGPWYVLHPDMQPVTVNPSPSPGGRG
jgi:predicted lipoprotein with Yx(FWY)xxD motif